MKNTFILKNTNPSFETYFNTMKKRKVLKNQNINLSTSLDGNKTIPLIGQHIIKNKPNPRDGHTSFVYQNKMFIFGGDRHHMPFNDLFFLQFDD
mmetsp:Transcript_48099/g.35304  ORF Transcript_48099/g.35304 Transcript_48099/m.35304 type:complete len:94 (+) Transcript_48099:1218-1499(+)